MQIALSVAAARMLVAAAVLGSAATLTWQAHEQAARARAEAEATQRLHWQPHEMVKQAMARYPSELIDLGARQQWALVCQARTDTDGSGRLDERDQRVPYLFRDANNRGELVDRIEAKSSDGRWVIAARAGGLAAIDVWTGNEHIMPSADLDRSGRHAKLDPGEDHLVYFRSPRSTILAVRDLVTGDERTFDVGRDVEYFDVADGPWVGLRYRRPVHAGEHRPWGPRLHATCGDDELDAGSTEIDAWLDVTTGVLRAR